MMATLASEPDGPHKASLHAMSEHFYVDTERPTAAEHAKQVAGFQSHAFAPPKHNAH